MKREEKIEMIQEIIEKKDPYIGLYAELLLSMGDMKLNYRDYMITEPINCSEELKRVFNADYDLCAALLTMVLREDHFSNGSFKRRFTAGFSYRCLFWLWFCNSDQYYDEGRF